MGRLASIGTSSIQEGSLSIKSHVSVFPCINLKTHACSHSSTTTLSGRQTQRETQGELVEKLSSELGPPLTPPPIQTK